MANREEPRSDIGGTGAPEWQRCPYCKGSLDPRYHFCVHCATVYREPDGDVYDEEPPLPPSLERRLVEEGGAGWSYFCILAVGLVSIGSVAAAMGEAAFGPAILIQDVFILGLTVFYLTAHWPDIAYLFQGVRPGSALIAALPLLAVALGVNKLYHEFLMSLLDMEGQRTIIDILKEALPPSLVFFTVCIFPGIFEEIGFRGIVQERLVSAAGVTIGFILTSGLFAAVHFTVLSAPYLFLLSLLLCWVRHETRSLYPSMVLHFLHNAAVLFFFTEL